MIKRERVERIIKEIEALYDDKKSKEKPDWMSLLILCTYVKEGWKNAKAQTKTTQETHLHA